MPRGLTDVEIAMLIGDKTGPAIIAAVCGDLRQDHLSAQAKRIQLRAKGGSHVLSHLEGPQGNLC